VVTVRSHKPGRPRPGAKSILLPKVAEARCLDALCSNSEIRTFVTELCFVAEDSVVSRLGGSLVTMAWRVLRLRIEGSPPVTEGSCEYIQLSSRGQPTRGGPPAWALG
jgi:hypothetical protein